MGVVREKIKSGNWGLRVGQDNQGSSLGRRRGQEIRAKSWSGESGIRFQERQGLVSN
jgi:hypothetical protein